MPFFQLFDCQSNNRKSVKKKRSVLMQAGVRLRRLRGGRDKSKRALKKTDYPGI